MLGSQALETAIGLTLLFFVVALAVSAATETVSRLTGKRGKALEEVLGHMLGAVNRDGIQINDTVWKRFKETSVFRAAEAASGRSLFLQPKKPSYLSAKSFADAVAEMVGIKPGAPTGTTLADVADVTNPLGQRMRALADGIGTNVHPADQMTAVKAGLERWYDETMDRLEGAYKRWVTLWVFILGLFVAVVANASTYHVAERLWQDPTTREAVVAAAGRTVADPPTSADLDSVAETTDRLSELSLPVGWDDTARDAWSGGPFSWAAFGYLLGWLTTAGLATLGAPFWFDLLTRLVSLRDAGAKPKAAADDPGSATSALNRRPA